MSANKDEMPDADWAENDEYAAMQQDGDDLTTTASTRWEWLATIVAGSSVGTFLGLIASDAAGWIALTTLAAPWSWLLAAAVSASYAYSLGKEFYKWRKGAKNE